MISKICKNCTHFIGGGDWNLCCDLKPDLCYAEDLACIAFQEFCAYLDGKRVTLRDLKFILSHSTDIIELISIDEDGTFYFQRSIYGMYD